MSAATAVATLAAMEARAVIRAGLANNDNPATRLHAPPGWKVFRKFRGSRLGQDVDPVGHFVKDEEGLGSPDAGQLVQLLHDHIPYLGQAAAP